MDAKSKIGWAVVVVISLVLVSACIGKKPVENSAVNLEELEGQYPGLNDCGIINDPFMKSDCLKQKAVDLNDWRICVVAPNELGISECLREIALEYENRSVCDRIENSTYRDGCFYSYAITFNDQESCREISSTSSKERCLAKTAKSAEVCESFENQFGRDWCVKDLALKTSTPELCAKVQTQSLRDSCYIDYVKENTLASSNCYRIVDEVIRNKCLDLATILTCPIDAFSPKYGIPIK
ncbi:MAG: hypothetical protein ABH950_09375 [Candidatus Altiarchaeota archaeon]